MERIIESESRTARILPVLGLAVVAVFGLLRFVHLEADTPWDITWSGAPYTDEGIYNHNAVAFVQSGQWHLAGDWNTAINYPVISCIQALVFQVFGVSLWVARAIPAVCSLGVIAAVWWLVRHYAGGRAGQLAALLCAINYTFFCYSRFANTDLPMVFFSVLALVLVLYRTGPTPVWAVALSAACTLCAVLSKTTAVSVLPALVVVLWLGNHGWRARLRAGLAFGGVLGAGLLIYAVLIVYPYWSDHRAVTSVVIEFERSPRRLLSQMYSAVRVGTYVDRLLYPLALLLVVGLPWVVKDSQRRLIILACAAWLAVHLIMIGTRGYLPPRYYLPLVPPTVILVAVGLASLPGTGKGRRVAAACAAVVLAAIVYSGYRTTRYMLHPQYSLWGMGQSIRAHAAAEGIAHAHLLGHAASTVALIADLPYVGEHLGAEDEAFKIRTHRPTHYVSIGPAGVASPRTTAALRDAGYELELVERYDVFGNYSGARDGMYLYRLGKRSARQSAARPPPPPTSGGTRDEPAPEVPRRSGSNRGS